jgi:hypothetical protein
MSVLAVERLAGLATLPYRRGAETLVIPLGADVAGATTIPPYDFADYRARHGADPPAPRYVLAPLAAVGRDPLAVEMDFDRGAGVETASFEVPAATAPGLSFAVPLPADAGPALRLLRFRQAPTPLPGPGAASWRLVALLGNLSKLLWILGREMDEIQHQFEDVGRQRALAFAHGASLDLLGRDLRVPRFPPREHSFEAATLALYHLNDHPVADGGDLADETTRFGVPGHTARSFGAASGATGKFGFGFRVPGPSGSGRLEIPHHADFNLAANADFTVELFARIEPAPDPAARVVVLKGGFGAAGNLTNDGWALATGEHRGIPDNLRWTLRSGGQTIEVFADLSLGDGAFHHLAGTVDRGAGRARLFVDGVERAAADITGLGAIANGQAIRVGRSATGHQLAGTVDELRLSSVARSEFHPVLGEGDAAYRRRLAIFERWLLPAPDALLAAINGAASPVGGDPAPFVLVEKDRPLATAARLVRVVAVSLPPGAHLDGEGGRRSSVEQVCGRPEDEPGFQEAFLARHDRPEVLYAGGEAARRMQVVAHQTLDELIRRLAEAGAAGRVIVDRAHDAAEPGLHRVGRALALRHESLPLDQLAALAHRAGFDFVEHRSSSVFAAVAAGPGLGILSAPLPPAQQPPAADVLAGGGLDLTVLPDALSSAGRFEWTLVRCGPGRGHLVGHPADPPGLKTPLRARRRVRLVADAPGEVTVAVEYRLRGVTVTGSRSFRVTIADLADGVRIAADGDTTADEAAAVGGPEADFDPIYLVDSTLPVTFDPGPNTRRMQVSLERRLERLLALAGAPPAQLRVRQAFVPGDPGLPGVGRAVLLRHGALAAGPLAALAHQAGFGYVERRGADVYASVAAGERIEIVRSADGSPLPEELPLGTAVPVAVRPSPLPAAGTFNWSLDPVGQGRGRLAPVLRPASVLTPVEAGLLGVNALYIAQDPQATPPYAFEVRLKPALEAAGAILPKHEYDLVMNILNFFHPIGVEVLTRRLRERVVEVRDNLLNAFPGYTYPDFRV